MVPDPLLLATAVEVVLRAGEMQLARLGSALRVDRKESAIDLVTEVDVAVESMFRALMAARFPDHGVLAEELSRPDTAAGSASPYCWVFDPIDGTTNYTHGLPFFCASLALELEGVPLVGAVYDPTRKELFTAERGLGARLNGAPLRVSNASTLLDSMLCTGFPYNVHETVDEIVGLFGRFVAEAQAVRRLGSAALDLCYVAAGRLDGFWEQRLHPWDTAAAALIVAEAGGRVTSLTGGPYSSRDGSVVASNGDIHDQMLAVIRAFDASTAR